MSLHLQTEADIQKYAKEMGLAPLSPDKIRQVLALIKRGASDAELIPAITGKRFFNGVQRARQDIANAQSPKDRDNLATCRQSMTKVANDLSSAAGRTEDPKAKAALKKAEQLVDQARNILFDAQE